jgi:competence protein ComEA
MLTRNLDEGKISQTKEILRKKWDVSLFFSLPQQWILLVLALLLLGSLTLKFYTPLRPTPSTEPVKEIVVEVSGEVRQPGIYLFQNPPNLKDAVDRAGGLKKIAHFDTTLSSTILETGTLLTVAKESSQIYPSLLPPSPLSRGERGKGEAPSQHHGMTHDGIKISIARMAANKLLAFSIPLDLNHVSAEDLCLIPGIGQSLAQEMIAYRERRKGFRSAEDLRNVRGIGRRKYENLKGFFTVK